MAHGIRSRMFTSRGEAPARAHSGASRWTRPRIQVYASAGRSEARRSRRVHLHRRQFGNVRKRSSGRWQAMYTDPDGRRQSGGMFTSKTDANAALAKIQTEMLSGTLIDPRQSRRTVEAVARAWLAANPHKRANTYATDEVDVNRHIVPALGSRQLRSIRPNDVQVLVNTWASTAAPRTVKRRLGTLRSVFRFAVDNDWLARSPVRNIKSPSVTSTRSRILSDSEVASLAEATPDEYRAMVWLGALTGCRWSEAAGLRVGDLDLLAGTRRSPKWW